MIITDEKILRQVSENVSLEEGNEIVKLLFDELKNHPTGIGLSAIQIGIPKNVFVIKVKSLLAFINPKIIRQSLPITFTEGCLSFPNETVRTTRYSNIEVIADNYEGVKKFGVLNLHSNILESVAIQHEIDHLNGILMFDRNIDGINKLK